MNMEALNRVHKRAEMPPDPAGVVRALRSCGEFLIGSVLHKTRAFGVTYKLASNVLSAIDALADQAPARRTTSRSTAQLRVRRGVSSWSSARRGKEGNAVDGAVTYFVAFSSCGAMGELVPGEALDRPTSGAAVREARRMMWGGAVAFPRIGDPANNEFEDAVPTVEVLLSGGWILF